MVERAAGAVLNIASIAGFQPMPDMAVYSATKAFVQTFSEAVHEELHGTGVSVTVLCPGPGAHRVGRDRSRRAVQYSPCAGFAARRRRGGHRRDARRQAQRAPVSRPRWSAPAADSYRVPRRCPGSGSATDSAVDPAADGVRVGRNRHMSLWRRTAHDVPALSVLGTAVKVDICVGDPRKGGSVVVSLVGLIRLRAGAVDRSRGRGGAPAAQRGRTTSRPTRIRRILGRRGVRVKMLRFKSCGASVSAQGRRDQSVACRRPALSGSTDEGPAT